MQIAPSGDRISELLHVVLIEICQKIVSYTDELVISGLVCVSADGIEVCRIPFDNCIRRNESIAFGGGGENPRTESASETLNSNCPTSVDLNGFLPSDLTKVSGECGDLERVGCGVDTANCTLPIAVKTKEVANCWRSGKEVEDLTENRASDDVILDCDRCDGDALTKMQTSSSSEIGLMVGNLGEIIMEYWERITPELLRTSELLCRLGELQHVIGSNSLSKNDCHSASLNLCHNIKKHNGSLDQETFNSCRNSESTSEGTGRSLSTFETPTSVCRSGSKCRACRRTFNNLLRHQQKFHAMPCGNTVHNSNISSSGSSKRILGFGGNRVAAGVAKKSTRDGSVRTAEKSSVKNNLNLDHWSEQHTVSIARGPNASNFALDAFRSIEATAVNTDSSTVRPHLEKELEVCDEADDDNNSSSGYDNKHVPAKDINSTAEKDDSALFESGDDGPFKSSVSTRVMITDGVNENGECFMSDRRNLETRENDVSLDISDDNSSNCGEEIRSFNTTATNTSSEVFPLPNQDSPDSNAKGSDAVSDSPPELLTSNDPLMFKLKKFDCSLCKASFSMISNLQRHVRKIHGTIKDAHSRFMPSFEPVLDVLNTESNSDLRLSRSSRYRHICVFCDAAFTFRTNLTRHMKKIHGKIPIDIADQPSKSHSVK